MIIETKLGKIDGIEHENHFEFRGIRYATAERFEYPVPEGAWEGVYDATKFGACCFQRRAFEDDATCNAFYHKEFRAGLSFEYSEDCLFLNIYAPKHKKDCPVVLYIHGGSFTGGSSDEGHIDGRAYAERGIVFVAINYRINCFGFAAHQQLEEGGVCGNYGLADQQVAIEWVSKNIDDFGGDSNNIVLLGQSAGAMSVDIQLSNPNLAGKISGAIMMSGAGIQRLVAKPLKPEKAYAFWDEVLKNADCTSMEELKKVDPEKLFYAWSDACKANPLSALFTLPVRDGRIVTSKFSSANMPDVPVLLGVTITDMMPIALATVTRIYANKCGAYLYCFDRLLPGDDSGAWHSCDLLYAFATLGKNWRPFEDIDRKISELMVESFANFIRRKNPNIKQLPAWAKGAKNAMHFGDEIKTGVLDTAEFFKSTFSNKGAEF